MTGAEAAVANRIKEIRKARGWTQEDLATALGGSTTNQTVSKLERGVISLDQEWMYRISAALGVPWHDLMPKSDAVTQTVIEDQNAGTTVEAVFEPSLQTGPAQGVSGIIQFPPGADSVTVNLPVTDDEMLLDPRRPDVDVTKVITAGLVGDRDLPVYGAARGGPDGAVVVDNSPVEWVRRPAPLESVPRGFGLYVMGDSMSPAYEPGDMILVHPSKPPVRGSDVVLIANDEAGSVEALVKRLVTWTADAWQVQQFNPAEEFALPRSRWNQALRIVGKYVR